MERRLVEAFAQVSRWAWRSDDDASFEVGSWPGWWIVLMAQVPFDEYRADLVLASIFPADWDTVPWLVIVEVDGHDFHERTKAQAARDKRRDRFFTTRGASVVRFTGSEVWRDADRCAHEAFSCAMRLQQDQLMPHFLRFMRDRGTITAEQHLRVLEQLR